MCKTIMIIKMKQRHETAVKVQDALTKFGCIIEVRLGLHETSKDACSDDGIVILKLCGDGKEHLKLEEALNNIDGIRAKSVNLDEI